MFWDMMSVTWIVKGCERWVLKSFSSILFRSTVQCSYWNTYSKGVEIHNENNVGKCVLLYFAIAFRRHMAIGVDTNFCSGHRIVCNNLLCFYFEVNRGENNELIYSYTHNLVSCPALKTSSHFFFPTPIRVWIYRNELFSEETSMESTRFGMVTGVQNVDRKKFVRRDCVAPRNEPIWLTISPKV